jgi:hypothetical protein
MKRCGIALSVHGVWRMQYTMPIVAAKIYIAATCAYGFHRGWNGSILGSKKKALFIDRANEGLWTALWSPMVGPVLVTYAARRLEKNIRNIELEEEDWLL